jgi:integrase
LAGCETAIRRKLARTSLCAKTLWRLLYDTAARACKVLALDIEDRDLRNRCAKVRRKGISRRPTCMLPRASGSARVPSTK